MYVLRACGPRGLEDARLIVNTAVHSSLLFVAPPALKHFAEEGYVVEGKGWRNGAVKQNKQLGEGEEAHIPLHSLLLAHRAESYWSSWKQGSGLLHRLMQL